MRTQRSTSVYHWLEASAGNSEMSYDWWHWDIVTFSLPTSSITYAFGTWATFSWNCKKFSNCCSFMKKYGVSRHIFLLLCNIFFLKKFVSATKKISDQFEFLLLLLLKQIFWEKRDFVKIVNKKHVSLHLQHELMQHNSF